MYYAGVSVAKDFLLKKKESSSTNYNVNSEFQRNIIQKKKPFFRVRKCWINYTEPAATFMARMFLMDVNNLFGLTVDSFSPYKIYSRFHCVKLCISWT